MTFQDQIAKDVDQVDKIVSSFFRWHDKVYPTVPDKFTREITVSDEGNPITIDLSLRVAVKYFPDHAFPQSGDAVRFPVTSTGGDLPDSADYTVRRTRSKHFVILWVDCIDPNV